MQHGRDKRSTEPLKPRRIETLRKKKERKTGEEKRGSREETRPQRPASVEKKQVRCSFQGFVTCLARV